MKRIELNGILTRFTGLGYGTELEFTGSDGEGKSFSGAQIQEVFGGILSSLIPKEGFPGTKIKIIVEVQK